MPVPSAQLHPRKAVALFDAAVRVAVTCPGVWGLTLPSGAVLLGALFWVLEARRSHDGLVLPVAALTTAWVIRAISQGAACDFVESAVMGPGAPSTRDSLRRAIQRAPSLTVASALVLTLNAALTIGTLGIGFFFFGAHHAAFAATMKGRGSALHLYANCATQLGPTRAIAPWVGLCGLTQIFLCLNIHLAATLALSAAASLLGIEVSFFQRFASLGNPTWWLIVGAIAFVAFEPLRATTSALLVIDGRVRQQGLDILSHLTRLPRRKIARAPAFLAVVLLAWAVPAEAGSAGLNRLESVAEACALDVDLSFLEHEPAAKEASSWARFISRIERRAYDDGDCDAAAAELESGLLLYGEMAQTTPTRVDVTGRVNDILSRPEFKTSSAAAASEENEEEGDWFSRWWEKVWRWFQQPPAARPDRAPVEADPSASMVGAKSVMVITFLVLVGTLLFIVIKSALSPPSPGASSTASSMLRLQPSSEAAPKPTSSWVTMADESVAQGRYRDAIRQTYLALLTQLQRQGVIKFFDTRSNGECVAGFHGPLEHHAVFSRLTARFDQAWYGHVGIDHQAYLAFRELATPLLVTQSEETVARG
jgi:hypothetical protein